MRSPDPTRPSSRVAPGANSAAGQAGAPAAGFPVAMQDRADQVDQAENAPADRAVAKDLADQAG